MQYKFDMSSKREMIKNHMKLGGKNKYGEEIDINSLYLTRNGKPWIPIMAEFHFSRLNREKWEEEILKIKAGGITVIASYVFWIYHEETEGEFDFSGDRDLHAFLALCKKHGMRVVLRIGPWAHGEVRNGGFPDWLLKKPFKLRDNNDEYIALAKRLYTQIYNQVKDFLFDNDGTVVMIQLENELVDGENHLLRLKALAKEVGLNVPVYTVTGWNSVYGAEIPDYDVMPVFGGYPEAPWTGHTKKLAPSPNYFFLTTRNDSAIGTDLISHADDRDDVKKMDYNLYPFATCELGGGICVTCHRRPNILGDDVGALALVKLGCGNNMPGYYMYHGGTNKIGKYSTLNESKATGYPNDYPILSYDFQAAIGEFGLIRPQYREFKLQHLFLNDFMETFAPMDAFMSDTPVKDPYDTDTLRCAMRMKDGSGFVFVNNYQRITDMGDKEDVQFAVPMPNGSEFVFPNEPVTVKSGAYFMLPFNMDMNGTRLVYAMAQPICRQGNTYFFAEINGIKPEYMFDGKITEVRAGLDSGFDTGNVRIVTLTRSQALMLYKFNDEIYIGNGDMYFDGGKIIVYNLDNTDLSYWHYESGGFVKNEFHAQSIDAEVSFKETELDFESKYLNELYIGGAKNAKYYEIDLSKIPHDGVKRYISIDYVGDVAQIYTNGRLAADEYFYGEQWIVGEDIFAGGKKAVLAVSELDGQDIYFETDKTKGCRVNSISVLTEYKRTAAL